MAATLVASNSTSWFTNTSSFVTSSGVTIKGSDIDPASIKERVTTPGKVFVFTVNGLKPSTRHYFYLDSIDKSDKCVPLGKNIGDPIITGAGGDVQFNFLYDSGLPTTETDYRTLQTQLNSIVGSKVVVLKSSDEKSKATTTITVNSGSADIAVRTLAPPAA
jgi:hypothetical protein